MMKLRKQERKVRAKTLIGIDTNVLARYLLQDDEKQSKIASDLLESFDNHTMGYISTIVLVELYWLLKQTYKQPKSTIVSVFNELLTTNTLVIQSAEQVQQSLQIIGNSPADLADTLIALSGQKADCQYTATFDVKASKHAGMLLLL